MSVFTSLLNNTFTVEVPDRATDDQGGFAVAYAAAGSVQGRIRPVTGTERVVADSEEQQISHVLYVASLTTSLGYALGRGARVTVDDLTVEILGVREPSKAGEHWEVDCLERQVEGLVEVGS